MQTQNKYHERNLISINIQEERNLMPKLSDLIGKVILILHEKDKAKLFREGKLDSLANKCTSYVKRKFRPYRKINSHRSDTYFELSCNFWKRYHIHYKTRI